MSQTEKKICVECHKARVISVESRVCGPCEKHYPDPKIRALNLHGLSKAGFKAWEQA